MKFFISISLISAIILQSFSSLIIIAGYEINKEYITKMFCENKNKPMMHCNGKCHMQKQLKEQDKKEQSPVSTVKEKQETNHFFQTNKIFSFEDFVKITSFYTVYLEPQLIEISFSIFHPPTC